MAIRTLSGRFQIPLFAKKAIFGALCQPAVGVLFFRGGKVWNATSPQEILTLKGHTAEVRSVAFSMDGKRLASASNDKTVKLWDATSGLATLTLKGHNGPVYGVAFSANGNRLVSASHDQTVKVWDATSGQATLTLKRHNGPVYGVAFSADGNRLAATISDQTVKVWDATSGQETLTLNGHTGTVTSVAFSSDGKRLASASHDGTVKVWDARPRTPKFNVEHQALGLIRFLRAKPLARAAILDAIDGDATTSEQVRQRALELTRHWPAEQSVK